MHDRDRMIRKFAVHALTRPGNVLPAVAVAGAGLALGLWPLYLAAGAVYAGLAATTLLNKDEARKLLEHERAARPAPPPEPIPNTLRDPYVRGLFEQVNAEEDRVVAALERATVPLPEIRVELTGLMDDVAAQCGRAQAITDYLRSVDADQIRESRNQARRAACDAGDDLRPTLEQSAIALTEQLQTVETMTAELRRFEAQMHQVQSSLGAIRAQVAQLEVDAQPDASSRILGQVASARSYVQAITTPAATGEASGVSSGAGE